MDPREEYLEMLQKDLQRLKANSVNAVAEENGVVNAGITVKTTMGNQTTVARTLQKNIGNVETSIGCLDFSRIGDPHIPDGTFVDGVQLEEETVEAEKNEYLEMIQKDLQRLKANSVNTVKTPDPLTSPSQTKAKDLENHSSSTSKIVSIIGNQRIEGEFKRGTLLNVETSIGPGGNFTKLNDVKINQNSRLFGSPEQQHGGVEISNSLTKMNDFSNADKKTEHFLKM